jgi:hypothetical protein
MAQPQATPDCARHRPFTLKEVLAFIALKRDDRTVSFIESCHVSFPLDGSALDQLAQANTSTLVLNALNRVTAADLTLPDARAQVTELDLRIRQIETSASSERDRALAKFDSDSAAEREKVAKIDPKGEFESTAQYNQRKQQNAARLADFDRVHQANRTQLAAAWATKASDRERPYRGRIDFLKSTTYPDPRPVLYKAYDADTLNLTATIDGEEYRFEKLPAATAQTLKTNWPRVKVAQPFQEDPLNSRYLLLASLPDPVAGYSLKARSSANAESTLVTARNQMSSRNYTGAARSYRQVLAADPSNEEAKEALARIQTMQFEQSNFLQGLTAAGVWLDPRTQLLWTIKDSEHTVNWHQANDYCQALQLDKLSGWRLPSIQELKSLYDPSITKLTHKSITGQLYYRIRGPIELRSIFLWSSERQDSETSLWFNPSSGEVDHDRSNSKMDMHALCVRPYDPASDGLNEADAPSTASTGAIASPAPPSSGNLAEDSQRAATLYDGKRYAEAASLFARTCAAGNASDCDRLGFMYSNGMGVPRDYAKAKVFETKACDGGNPYGCNNLGFLEQTVDKDYAQAATDLTKACDAGNPNGCASLAFQYEGGLGVLKDISEARDLYAKSCKLGYQWGCEQQKRLQ